MKIWNLAYPRIGHQQELRTALESHWSGALDEPGLLDAGKKICADRWKRQHDLGVDSIPLNDFSFFDHMLDMAWLLGAVPKRFTGASWLENHFAMSRGNTAAAPLRLTKWFNTQYQYLVPEIDGKTDFGLKMDKLSWELQHSRSFPYKFHTVLVGPWTFLKLARVQGMTMAEALKEVIPVYQALLKELGKKGTDWVQMDEPAFALDMEESDWKLIRKAYDALEGKGPKIMLATYYESPDPWLSEIGTLPVTGVHFDLFNGPATLSWLKTRGFPKDKHLSLGLVNGRNVWAASLSTLNKQLEILGGFYLDSRTWIAPSCPLIHLPLDKNLEKWDPEFLSWISFADQRLEELKVLKDGAGKPELPEWRLREKAMAGRLTSPRVSRSRVQAIVNDIEPPMKKRGSSFTKRLKLQKRKFNLPHFPTSTIGSFPVPWDKNHHPTESEAFAEIKKAIEFQEKLGLDVLVTGEAERVGAVEFFAENLEGFMTSEHAWVQLSGSHCLRPPILFGDVERKAPVTVKWFQEAARHTQKPLKASLTGPVTLLSWSFAREDQPPEKVAFQLALFLRREIKELEAAGAKMIQVDEPALRDALPLKKQKWAPYQKWAIEAFKLATCGVSDETQVQSHVCYSDLDDIAELLSKLDCDVLLLECARTGAGCIETFKKHQYDGAVGVGVYDPRSTRVPTVEEMEKLVRKLCEVFAPDRVWLSPDCGLKHSRYENLEAPLKNIVDLAHRLRKLIT